MLAEIGVSTRFYHILGLRSFRLRELSGLAAVEQPDVARGILECLGLSSRAPPLTPAASPEPTDLELGFEEHWSSDEPGEDG